MSPNLQHHPLQLVLKVQVQQILAVAERGRGGEGAGNGREVDQGGERRGEQGGDGQEGDGNFGLDFIKSTSSLNQLLCHCKAMSNGRSVWSMVPGSLLWSFLAECYNSL